MTEYIEEELDFAQNCYFCCRKIFNEYITSDGTVVSYNACTWCKNSFSVDFFDGILYNIRFYLELYSKTFEVKIFPNSNELKIYLDRNLVFEKNDFTIDLNEFNVTIKHIDKYLKLKVFA